MMSLNVRKINLLSSGSLKRVDFGILFIPFQDKTAGLV